MSFTRTPSGLANYRIFYDVKHVVYIEGKREGDCCSGEVVHDGEFYSSLLLSLRPDLTFKVKSVGNCSDVVDHVRKACDAGDKAAIGIVDKDCADVLYSGAYGGLRVITTRGYSWENDLWTADTVRLVFGQLSLARRESVDYVVRTFEMGVRRLGVLSRLDVACRIHGEALFKKNGGSCGFAVDCKHGWGISRQEVSRLIKKYRSSPAMDCVLSRAVLERANNISPSQIVQGHLLVAVACAVISYMFRTIHVGSTLSHVVIINTALSVFKEKVRMCLGNATYQHYQSEVTRLFPQAA